MVSFKLPNPITKSMISSPISSPITPGFELQTLPPWLTPALEYISRRLQDKYLHITLILANTNSTNSNPTCPHDNIRIIPASPLDARSHRLLTTAITKATRKYSISDHYFTSILNPQPSTKDPTYLIRRSILQNQILFSSEGLTLLTVDHVYTLKSRLQHVSLLSVPLTLEARLDACVTLLRHLTKLYSGRPLTKGYIMRAYDHLHISEGILGHVNRLYETRYGTTAVIMGSKISTSPKPDPKQAFPRFPQMVGPKTPLTATDITPTTRGEWNHILIGLQC
ncbi:MAG: hypothetical protein M1836_001023 [Candelina mexicana]|nr:MAG: hypothetical protein M1836_001023 [Candelina mexicana]